MTASVYIHRVIKVEVAARAYDDFTATHLTITDHDGCEFEITLQADADDFPLAGVGIDTVKDIDGRFGPGAQRGQSYTIAEWLARVAE